jgi:hypothetical protein
MGYSLHATVPVTPSNDFTSENMKCMPGRGVPVLLHITQFHLSVPEYAPCSCESCRVSGLGVINDIEVLDYEWLVGREVTA